MKLIFLVLLNLILCSFLFVHNVNGLSLFLRNKNQIGTSNEWSQISTAPANTEQLTCAISGGKVDLLQFRVDIEDETRIINDQYINVTSIRTPSRESIGISFDHPPASNELTKTGYTPIYFGFCGSNSVYFSLGFNNSYISNLTITVTSRDTITMCQYN